MLEEAPYSTCPSCRRETKTVDGVCADCWAPKEPGARPMFPSEPRTWPLFDWDVSFLWIDGGFRLAVLAAGLVGLVLLALLGLR